MRIALGLEYDGEPFCGWQHQPSECGVQDYLESALRRFAGAPIATVAAGRTDAGVHACAQVVHLDCDLDRESFAWIRGTNAFLPPGIRVIWARPVRSSFHARFSATSRTYRYLLLDDPVPPAILRGKVGWFHRRLDVAAMADAGRCLVGRADFTSFRGAQCQANSAIRTLHELTVKRHDSLVIFRLRANSFLHHMVRNIVGSLVYVGAERQPIQWLASILSARDRRLAAPTFAPDGLYLESIEYDRSWGLPSFRSNALLT